MAFCPKCGVNVGNSLFCGNCGAKITFNENANNINDDINELKPSANTHRVKVHLKPKTEPESISNEQNFFASEPLPSVQPEPQYNEIPESNIYSGQKEPSFYSQEPTDIFSNTNLSKAELYRDAAESGEHYYNSDIEKQSNASQKNKTASPKKQRKKLLVTIVCIISAAGLIISAVAAGFYVIKPKADLYVIANAVAKTVFQSGSFNFNIDEVYYPDGYTEENGKALLDDNYNGCVIWGDKVKDSYLYIYAGDDDGVNEVIKYENSYWKVSYDGYEFDRSFRGLPTFNDRKVSTNDFESTTIDEAGFESFLDYAVIPFINDEFTEYWDSSLNSLTAKQSVEILTAMLSDEDFNMNAVEINSKEKVDDGTEYSLTVDVNSLIKACWNYLKTSDIYTVMLDNSENREEFNREMNEFFERDSFLSLQVQLAITIDDDGYINYLTYQEGYDYGDGFEYDDTGYRVEIYNFGQAVKQK